MIKNFSIIIIAILAYVPYWITNSDFNELVVFDDSQTIKELKDNINLLDETSTSLIKEYDELNTDYELKAFLRRDLTLIEFNKIRRLVGNYNTNKSRIEIELFQKAKDLLPVVVERRLLLEEKRKLYSWLIPYINIRYKAEYLDYIRTDAKIFNEQKDVSTDIISKQEILSNKVEIIENKIQEHKDYLNESIKIVIETKLDEKITNLNQNETFKVLNTESKIKVLNKTIDKVKLKLNDLEDSNNLNWSWALNNSWTWIIVNSNSNILDKKIQTYYIAVEKLEEFRNSLK